MKDEEQKTMLIEGRGCIFETKVVFIYPLRNSLKANIGVYYIGGIPPALVRAVWGLWGRRTWFMTVKLNLLKREESQA